MSRYAGGHYKQTVDVDRKYFLVAEVMHGAVELQLGFEGETVAQPYNITESDKPMEIIFNNSIDNSLLTKSTSLKVLLCTMYYFSQK